MGAAGDMLMSALYELVTIKNFPNKMNNLGIPGVNITAKESVKRGIAGTHISVKVRGWKKKA